MNQNTNVQTVSVAALFAAVVIWLLGYFAPDLMATAPMGFESLLSGGFIAIMSYLLPRDKVTLGVKQK